MIISIRPLMPCSSSFSVWGSAGWDCFSQGAWMTDLKKDPTSVALLSLPAPLPTLPLSPSVPFSLLELHHSQPISSVHPRRELWLMKLSQARNPNHTKKLPTPKPPSPSCTLCYIPASHVPIPRASSLWF